MLKSLLVSFRFPPSILQDQFNKDYENCTARETWKLGDGECTENDPDTYNSAACGFEGGDCIAFNTNETYAECKVANPSLLGNGMCNGKLSVDPSDYNSEACAFDGGDCSRVNEYPNCTFPANFLYQFLGGRFTHVCCLLLIILLVLSNWS